jgi:hypothetical protein
VGEKTRAPDQQPQCAEDLAIEMKEFMHGIVQEMPPLKLVLMRARFASRMAELAG